MRSAAAAIAWEFRGRHRWGLIALVAYVLALAAIRVLVVGPGGRVEFDREETFAFFVLVPFAASFMYLLAVFTFGLSGDIAARQSIYPTRLFTLPVTTGALAGLPMLYGTIAMALLWFATRLLAVWPSGIDIPLYWPALLGAASLAWMQALSWMPYPLPALRVIVTVLWMTLIDAAIMLALEFKAPEPVMVAILAPHLPIAYLVARFAVARARRGDVPDWRGVFGRFREIADISSTRREQFSSPARAQEWFEWRQHGRSLPMLVGILLPFELALLFFFDDVPFIVFETLVMVFLTPPFMAVFVAATISTSTQRSDSYGVTPFMATRPLTSASLVAAKLKTTIWSALAAWLLVLVAVPIALRLSGASAVVMEWGRNTVDIFGTPRAIGIALLGIVLLATSTWKQLVQSLCIGMSGREWLVKASVFATLSLLAVIVPLGEWIFTRKGMIAFLLRALPWIAAGLVCLKLFASGWIAVRLHRNRLLSDRALILGAVGWDLLVFVLYGVLIWLLPALMIPYYFLALVAILEIPLARLAAAPLALAWNRHR